MVRTKVFVGNLDFTTKEAELVKEFGAAGKVISANIITRGPRSLGYGFVEMESEEDANKAVQMLNKKEIDGRPVNVEVAKPRDESAEDKTNTGTTTQRGGFRGRGGRGQRGTRGGRGAPRGGRGQSFGRPSFRPRGAPRSPRTSENHQQQLISNENKESVVDNSKTHHDEHTVTITQQQQQQCLYEIQSLRITSRSVSPICTSSIPSITGLHYLPDFITAEEEQQIVSHIDSRHWSQCIHRRQQYYGQTYYHTTHDLTRIQPVYTDNDDQHHHNNNNNKDDIEPTLPLSDFQWLIDRCYAIDKQMNLGIFKADSSNAPTQILVNEYVENQGISSHFDDSNAFGDYILTLSLLQPLYMTLKKPEERTNQCQVILDEQHCLLMPRSLMVKCLDVRYAYRHGIKKTKYIHLPSGEIIHRGKQYRRISLTIRKLLDGRKQSKITHSEWYNVINNGNKHQSSDGNTDVNAS